MRFPVADWVERKLTLRSRSEGQHGLELVCHCPLCGGRSKLYVNGETGRWICYKCSERGKLIDLIEKIDGVSRAEAIRFIFETMAQQPGRAISEMGPRHEEPREEVRVELPEEFIPVNRGDEWVMPIYLQQRGISPKVSARYGLGFCEQGRYAGRIILPARQNGVLRFFQARATIPDLEPKYLAPQADRSSVLWGYDEAVAQTPKVVVLVEGPFDVLGCAMAKIPAVGLMGKVVSATQAGLLGRAFDRVLVLLDPDARKDAVKVARVLSDTMKVMVLDLPPELGDPGSAPREALREVVSAGVRRISA